MSLSRCFYTKDFYDDKNLHKEDYRAEVLAKALSIADSYFSDGIALSTTRVGKKAAYMSTELAEKLVLRKCASNIKKYTKIKQKHRSTIIRELKGALKEGTPYRVYRLDISSFFESIDVSELLRGLEAEYLSTQTINIISSYLNAFNNHYGRGLPRGVEISPILAELSLKGFDKLVASQTHVFYYARFVDDMIIVSSGVEDKKKFMRWLRKNLPKGLSFNFTKQYIMDVAERSKGDPSKDNTVASFEYLGYQLKAIDYPVSSNKRLQTFRAVSVDISKAKVNKIKSRISKSFYSFVEAKDYKLLSDRLIFLSSNRNLINKDKQRKVPTGIYYNYSEADFPSPALTEIDTFTRNILLSRKGRLSKKLSAAITKKERSKLLKISFEGGFKNRTFKRFSPDRLKDIARGI